MNRFFLILFFALSLTFPSISFAQDENPVNIEFGADIYHFTYEEPIFDLEDSGVMYGIFGVATLRSQEENSLTQFIDMYQAEGRFNYGKVDYESAPSGTIDDITDYTFEFRGLVGKDFDLNNEMVLTPFIGLGYRYLNDDTSGKRSSTGALGYERESRYFYLPIGAELTTELSEGWDLAFKGEYDVFLEGEQTSHLSDVSGLLPDLKNKQKDGFGYRVSAKLSRETESLNYFVEPFIRYWHIQDSESTTASGSGFIVTGFEPENKSREIGARVGIEF